MLAERERERSLSSFGMKGLGFFSGCYVFWFFNFGDRFLNAFPAEWFCGLAFVFVLK